MLSSRQPKQNLSKNLLQMKFMQKHRAVVLREEQEEQYRAKLSEEHWYLDDIDDEELKDPAETEASFVICEDLLPIGRMSFKNFNPSVEKVYSELLRKRDLKLRGLRDEEEGISDEEMAMRYETLVDTVSKKFRKKRKAKELVNDDEMSSEEETKIKTKKQKTMFKKPKLE